MYDCMVYPENSSKPLLCDEALLELRYYSGTVLDPDVVETFIGIMNPRSARSSVMEENKVLSGGR